MAVGDRLALILKEDAMRSSLLVSALIGGVAAALAIAAWTGETPKVRAEENSAQVHRDVDGWIFEDLESAKAKAQEEGKPLLVAFR